MLFLILGLVACDGPQTTLYTFASLPGEPRGIALAADGNLVVTHESGGACCRLTGFLPSASIEVYDRGAGPGPPMVSDGRTYFAQPSGMAALDGDSLLWDLLVDGDVEEPGPTAVTPAGVVLLASWDGAEGRLYGFDRLGEQLWVSDMGARVNSAVRVSADGVAYLTTTDGITDLLHAIDGATGAILWSVGSVARPLAVVEDGVLVDQEGMLAKLDLDGLLLWTSDVPVGSGGITLTHDGDAWVPGPESVSKVGLEGGQRLVEIQKQCGPLAYGLDNQMWGICSAGAEGQVALTTLGATALPVSEVFVGRGVGAPVLVNGSAFVLVGGEGPRLLGFSGASPASTTSPWSSAAGVGNTGRPD